MARKATSIKGEVVDFDLLELKRTIGDKPVSADVKNRENFVYSKRKRGSKRAVQKMMQQSEAKAPEKPKVTEKPKASAPADEKPDVKKTTKRKIIKKTTGEK